MSIRSILGAAVIAAGVHAAGLSAHAAIVSWDGGAGTSSWQNPLNWSGDVLPGSGDDVVIPAKAPGMPVTLTNSVSINSLQCHGEFNLRSGTLTLAAESTIHGGFVLGFSSSAVQLTGNGLLRIEGDMAWTHGTLAGSGGIRVERGGTLNTFFPNAKTLARTIVNHGQMLFSDANVNMQGLFGATPILHNTARGTVTLESVKANSSLGAGSAPQAPIVNDGVILVQGEGISFIEDFLNVQNTGSIVVQSGGLRIAAPSDTFVNQGQISVQAGAQLQLGNNVQLMPGSTLSGDGTVKFVGGVHTIMGHEFSPTGEVAFEGDPEVTFQVVFEPSTLTVNSANAVVTFEVALDPAPMLNRGTVFFNVDQTLTTLTMQSFGQGPSALVSGPGDLTIADELVWVSGTMAGAGQTNVPVDGTMTLTRGTLSRTLNIHGVATQPPSANALTLGGGTLNIHPGGEYHILTSGSFPVTGVGNAINNDGTITYFAPDDDGEGVNIMRIFPTLTNNGLIQIQDGRFEWHGGGANNGDLLVDAVGTCRFMSTITHAAGSLLAGAGRLEFGSGVHNVPPGSFNPTGAFEVRWPSTLTINNTCTLSGPVGVDGTLIVNADQSWDRLYMGFLEIESPPGGGNNAKLDGTGDVEVTERLFWDRGQMLGAGRTIVAPSGLLEFNIPGKRTLSRTFDLAGQHHVDPAGDLGASIGSTLRFNNGTFNVLPTGRFQAMGGDSFTNDGGVNLVHNAGLLERMEWDPKALNIFTVNVPLLNTGVVRIREGRLLLFETPAANFNPATGELSGGTWRIDNFATLQFPAGQQVRRLSGAIEFRGENSLFLPVLLLDTILPTGRLAVLEGRALGLAPLFTGTLINHGQIVADDQSGFVTLFGISQSESGRMEIEVGPDVSPIPMTGTQAMQLGGTLEIDFAEGFAPDMGDSFTLISMTGGFSGAFGEIIAPDGSICGLGLDVDIVGATVIATVILDSAPDLNCDGLVNGIDLGVVLAGWSVPAKAPGCGGAPACPADLNDDGLVNGVDLGIVLANWTF